MELTPLAVLSPEEIRKIHEASLDILAGCGVKIPSPPMLSFLEAKGLDIHGDIVRFPRAAVEDALALAPERFEVFDRDGNFAFVLGDRKPKVAAGHNAVFWVDTKTGATRRSAVSDVELFARICDRLECIHAIGMPVMPQDVPDPRKTLLHAVRAVIENSSKPVFFSTDNAKVNRACIEMLRCAFPGDLKRQVYGISQLSSTSPLFWEEGVLDAMMDQAPTGVPLAILPEPISGFTAPYTLAGLITMNNAECLSGVVLWELLEPGAKVLYANSWTTFDMRAAAALVGSAETTVCRIAGAQLARFYKLPCHTTAPNSDNHAHDEQNAWEKTLSQFCAIAAGNDLIVNCGMFATGMTCSHEQLLMDEEISALSLRIASGITVTEETIAADLIRKVGPQGGNYLTEDHTLGRLRSGEYVAPRLSVRGSRAAWEKAGAKDTYALARERVREYGRLPARAPRPGVPARLAEILASF